jgi:hypothetical protein
MQGLTGDLNELSSLSSFMPSTRPISRSFRPDGGFRLAKVAENQIVIAVGIAMRGSCCRTQPNIC